MLRLALAAALATSVVATAAVAQATDPYLWLEEIEGAKPLEQVKAWNAATENLLTAMPGFAERQARALKVLQDPAQIAMPSAVIGDKVLNHWVDADHKRGLWRIASLDNYIAGNPDWRVLIDVDALG